MKPLAVTEFARPFTELGIANFDIGQLVSGPCQPATSELRYLEMGLFEIPRFVPEMFLAVDEPRWTSLVKKL